MQNILHFCTHSLSMNKSGSFSSNVLYWLCFSSSQESYHFPGMGIPHSYQATYLISEFPPISPNCTGSWRTARKKPWREKKTLNLLSWCKTVCFCMEMLLIKPCLGGNWSGVRGPPVRPSRNESTNWQWSSPFPARSPML